MNITGTEIFKRTAGYEREASNIRLHAPQWKLLLAFDGQRTLSEIALGSGVPFAEARPFVENFLNRAWIEEQPITLEEYLKRASAGGNFSGGVIPPSVIVNEFEKRESAKPPRLPTAGTSAPPLPSAGARAAGTSSVMPPSAGILPSAGSRGPMRLSAVVDYIVSVAENIPLGQLLAYRVFLRVPPEILQSEDIVSIHLVEDNSLVRSETLQKAISAAVQEIIKRPLPDSVYAPA
jgi:hypothetical protein